MIRSGDSEKQPKLAAAAGELLEDLETVRALLDVDEDDESLLEASVDDEVPLLDDPIDGTEGLREVTFSSVAGSLGHPAGRRKQDRLNAELFDSLLDDEWQVSASAILAGARDAIDDHRNCWTPVDTDELNEALRVRIDDTLSQWLRDTVSEHVEELRDELLRATERVISEKVEALIRREQPGDFPEAPA
jgi:hypothetical protein